MIRSKCLCPLGLPLLCHLIMIPHVMKCDRSKKCDRESVEVQLSDEVVNDIRPPMVAVNAVKDIACGFY